MGKEKRKSQSEEHDESMVGHDKEEKWNELLKQIGPIANPLASRKLTKKIYKCIKKAQKQKQLRKGVREVQKFIRKGEKGLVILAGDTSPIDVLSHMPLVCEEAGLPYCYTPAKEDLGAACGSRRPTCMVMIKTHESYDDLYDECSSDVQGLPQPIN